MLRCLLALLFVLLPLYPSPIMVTEYSAIRHDFNNATILLREKDIEIRYGSWIGRGYETSENTYHVRWSTAGIMYGSGTYWFYRGKEEFLLLGRYQATEDRYKLR